MVIKMKAHQIIPIGQFKAKCLKLLQEIAEKHTTLTVTKHGKKLVQITSFTNTEPKTFFGCMHGTVTIQDDITKPLDIEWNANEK